MVQQITEQITADMAKLVDAHGLGPCERKFLQVRLLLSAPVRSTIRGMECFYGSPFEE